MGVRGKASCLPRFESGWRYMAPRQWERREDGREGGREARVKKEGAREEGTREEGTREKGTREEVTTEWG